MSSFLNLPVLVDEQTARAVDHLSWLGVLGTFALMRENADAFVRTADGAIEMREPEPGDLGTAYWTAAQLVVDGPRISEAGSETALVAALLESASGAAAYSELQRDVELNLARLGPKHALELTKQVVIDYLRSTPNAVARIFGRDNPFRLQADGPALLHKQTLAAIAKARAFNDLPSSMTGSPLTLREDRIEFSQSPFGLSPEENKDFVTSVARFIADSQRTLDDHGGEAHVPEDAIPSNHAWPKLISD